MNFFARLEEDRRLIEETLRGSLAPHGSQARLFEAMRYSLLAGGKRIRPVLVLEFCRACGGEASAALPFAAAVEMLHTYSLIHDDLPCMDDDDMRRDKPTNHIVFGEAAAVLAGDALLTAAFETLLSAALPPEKVVEAGRILARSAGAEGMCGGQLLDLDGVGKKLSAGSLETINSLKTAALISAAARLGVIAGGGSACQLSSAESYGVALGLAFQIRDDILDASEGEASFASLLGPEQCAKRVAELTAAAQKAVSDAFKESGFLIGLADWLAGRQK